MDGGFTMENEVNSGNQATVGQQRALQLGNITLENSSDATVSTPPPKVSANALISNTATSIPTIVPPPMSTPFGTIIGPSVVATLTGAMSPQ